MNVVRLATIAFALVTIRPTDLLAERYLETSEAHRFEIEVVATGLEHPWSLAFLPNKTMLVTEREGRLRVIDKNGLRKKPVAGMPSIVVHGQGGLLDVAIHPNFTKNSLVYLSYAGGRRNDSNTHVARAKFDGKRLRNLEVIFGASPNARGGGHFGGRLLFHPDGTLFVTLGDRYRHKDQAQDPRNHLGTVVRITDDGGVPTDNPYAIKTSLGHHDVYSYGHRNVQGIAMRTGDQRVWAHEHGPKGGDELNILSSGKNYGWPTITYGIDYDGSVISDKHSAPGMEQPVTYWVPSIAPSGMTFYEGTKFPKWRGDLFIGALAHRHLRRLVLSGDKVVRQEKLLVGLKKRIRDVKEGPDGFLYVLTDHDPGEVLRLRPL